MPKPIIAVGVNDKVQSIDNMMQLPVKIPTGKVLINYRSTLKLNVALSQLDMNSHYRLCVGIAPKFADRGIIMLSNPAWLTNADQQLTIGHIGRDIIEINNDDYLFVGWLETNINF